MTTLGTNQRLGRIMLKLSGEAIAGERELGIDTKVLKAVASEIAQVARAGTQVAIVVGGGNMFRGSELAETGFDRPRADYMGMLSTVINALALQEFIDQTGIETRAQIAITMGQIAEPYLPRRAIRHMEKGRVVIFGGGLGAPYFSTDTTSAQRALELHCDQLLMAKNGVDGVYTADPRKFANATMIEKISHSDVVSRQLKVADATAFTLCMEHGLPVRVFDMKVPGNIRRIAAGENIGTLVLTEAGIA